MNNEMQRREIDSLNYEFAKWGAKKSVKILVRLGRIVGQPLAMVMSSLAIKKDAKSIMERDIDPDIIGKAAEALFTRMSDENEVCDLIETLTSGDNVMCEGKKVVFDLHYQDKLGHLMKVLTAALEVQYGNFFAALEGLPGQYQAKTKVSNQDLPA